MLSDMRGCFVLCVRYCVGYWWKVEGERGIIGTWVDGIYWLVYIDTQEHQPSSLCTYEF